MKLKRVYLVFAIIFLLIILKGLPVFASEYMDDNGNVGSITIRLEHTKENRSKANVHIMAAKIAEIVQGEYVLHREYRDCGINLNMLQNANELASAAEKLEQFKPEGKEVITDGDGVAVITDLSAGVYLVYACDIAEYDNIMPVLIANPMWNEVTGKMVYDIEVLPKHNPPTLETPGTPQTGDGNHAGYYILTLAGSLMIGGIGVFEKKKKGETLQKK